ncbi:MAG TPA: heme exporter protein CcmD [Myxococcota bacterium]|nr:heme exporter protein CcmD [Myxococcota bacterium]
MNYRDNPGCCSATGATAMQGMIVGGWEYIWSAYGLTFGVMLGYGLLTTLWLRSARARQEMK